MCWITWVSYGYHITNVAYTYGMRNDATHMGRPFSLRHPCSPKTTCYNLQANMGECNCNMQDGCNMRDGVFMGQSCDAFASSVQRMACASNDGDKATARRAVGS